VKEEWIAEAKVALQTKRDDLDRLRKEVDRMKLVVKDLEGSCSFLLLFSLSFCFLLFKWISSINMLHLADEKNGFEENEKAEKEAIKQEKEKKKLEEQAAKEAEQQQEEESVQEEQEQEQAEEVKSVYRVSLSMTFTIFF
jgi:hypothetical protein